MRRKPRIFSIILAIMVICSFGLSLPTTSLQRRQVQEVAFVEVLPGIQTFLVNHPGNGTPISVQHVPNWAEGERQRVQFDNGRNLLFYLKNGRVVSIYEDNPTRRKIWGS